MPEGLNSNLNLNQGAPPRVRPRIGEWGPLEVKPTKKKKRARWWAVVVLILVLAVLVGYGYWIHRILVDAVAAG